MDHDLTDLVAHGPGRVDQSPVGRTRDPVVGPPLVPVGESGGGEAGEDEETGQHLTGRESLLVVTV